MVNINVADDLYTELLRRKARAAEQGRHLTHSDIIREAFS